MMTILRTFAQLTPEEQARELRKLEGQFIGALIRGSVQLLDGDMRPVEPSWLGVDGLLARVAETARALAEEELYV